MGFTSVVHDVSVVKRKANEYALGMTKALILDKDGTLFPYSLWINPIRRALEENLPLKRFDEKKKKIIVDDFLSVLSIKENSIASSSLLFDKRKRPKGVLRLIKLTLKYRLNPFKALKGFLSIKKRSGYGFEEEIGKYNLDDVKNTLEKIRERGIVVALFSNDSPSSVRKIEEILGFKFDYTVDSSSRVRKPNPLAVSIFTTLEGIEPSDTLLLSDTIEDLKMAKKAGVGRITAVTGSLDKDTLAPYSDYVISSFSEIESII